MSLHLLVLFACTGPTPPKDDVEAETGTDSVPVEADADGDGYGPDEDCDEARADVHPGAVEYCDDADNDCDGLVDDADDDLRATPGTTWYADADADGFGSAAETACVQPGGTSAAGDDCDDANPAVYPRAVEACNTIDDNCDGVVDEACELTGIVGVVEANATLHCRNEGANAGFDLVPAADLTTGSGVDLVVRCDQWAETESYLPARLFVVDASVRGEVVLDEDATFVANGESGDETFGHSFATAELTGDGQEDLVVVSSQLGQVSVYAGPLAGEAGPADAARVIDLYVYTPDINGYVARAGDLDGDGGVDLLLGTLGENSVDTWWAYLGEVYVVPGGRPDVALADMTVVRGTEGASVGVAQGAPGDLDGDGVADLLLGSSMSYSGGGSAFVFYGPVTGTLSPAEADAAMTMFGGPTVVTSAGDTNGDGAVDLAFGAPYVGEAEGMAYVVDTRPSGAVAVEDIAVGSLSGAGHLRAVLGDAVDGAGDVDGDGRDDLLVGASGFGMGEFVQPGAAFLLYGPLSGSTLAVDADTRFASEADKEFTGYAVRGAGDVDADGFADMLVGSPGYSLYGYETGGVFLFLGRER
ncbi:MAG: MopE-related protein [Myxococcota bacterium]